MNLFDITGKKAIVTGGTRGLGYGIAEGYLEAGCEVAIVGTSDKVYEVAEEFCQRGYKCHGVKGNLGKREEVYRVFQECVEKLGGDLDILLTAHGIQRRHSAEEFPVEEWDEVLNVNLTSVFLLCQEAGKIMLKKGYGKIITIASMNSFFGGQTIPAYAAAKGGLKMLTKNIASEYGEYNIQCNGIGPGYIATPQTAPLREIQPDGSKHPFDQFIISKTPAARWGNPEDLMGPAVFLASEASDFVNGQILYVDGGILAYIGKQPK